MNIVTLIMLCISVYNVLVVPHHVVIRIDMCLGKDGFLDYVPNGVEVTVKLVNKYATEDPLNRYMYKTGYVYMTRSIQCLACCVQRCTAHIRTNAPFNVLCAFWRGGYDV